MLNKRQKQIIRDLENTTIPITAIQLSSKYDASLRTIRNDIRQIGSYLSENNIEFVRIPGQGMKIFSNRRISDDFNQTLLNSDFPYLNNDQRIILILMQFLFKDNPINADQLCETFKVSKGTIFSIIRSADELFGEFGLRISRYQNKGYELIGKTKAIIKAVEYIFRQEGDENIYNSLTDEENGYMDARQKEGIDDLLKFIANDLSLYISHHYFLSFIIFCMISRAQGSDHRTNRKTDPDDPKTGQLITYIQQRFSILLNKEDRQMIRYVLGYSTDYTANDHGDSLDTQLVAAIDAMINYVSSSGMYQINDDETLRIDLLVHLRSTVDAIRSGLPRDNPLLEEIRSTYPNEFNLIKSSAQRFHEIYPMDLSDDEIGFITLYFLKSFDRTEKIQETNVMVVCNTGRSASRLLATRLMNNIPDIHIVSMNSIYNIANDPNSLDNVDFIISTIPLNNVSKPHIVISPLLQKNEINKVKEAIWLSKSEIQTKGSIDEAAASVVEQYRTFEENGSNSSQFESGNLVPYSITAILGEVSMNVITLISELYPNEIPASAYGNISGIFAHIIMSIPRWQRGEFIRPSDEKEMIRKYSREYEIIKKYLIQESERLGVYIPEAEVITILRYYIY